MKLTLLCKCGEPAERNDYGELLCRSCAQTSDRGIYSRLGRVRYGFKFYGGKTLHQHLNERGGEGDH